MDITDILLTIEDNPNRRERCIAIAEVIIYLKSIKNVIGFEATEIEWKQNINDQVILDSCKSIDKEIERAVSLFDANLEQS